ncbi:hypothetical protein AC249_AIPGENE20404 [Exaiptasia diaphana]|nr:hypothetical protein AC249_AIPGENE20404 [Exaiptasia diaphana]
MTLLQSWTKRVENVLKIAECWNVSGFSGWEDTPAPEDEAAPSPFIDEPWRKIKGWGESNGPSKNSGSKRQNNARRC